MINSYKILSIGCFVAILSVLAAGGVKYNHQPPVAKASVSDGVSPIQAINSDLVQSLESGFKQPPLSARPLTWWHWINGNVTKSGIKEDLTAIKQAGIGGVQLFDVSIYLPKGPVRYGTDQWHEHVQYAIQTCESLGLEFYVMNCPGWSASGGPWITPERSMKQLVWSEKEVEGPNTVKSSLPQPFTKLEFYRDIAVVAVPSYITKQRQLQKLMSNITSSDGSMSLEALVDNNTATFIKYPRSDTNIPNYIELTYKEPVTVRLLDIDFSPRVSNLTIIGKIEASKDGLNFEKVHIFQYVIPTKEVENIFIPFKPVTARSFRIWLNTNRSSGSYSLGLSDIRLTGECRIADLHTKINSCSTSTSRPIASPVEPDENAIPRDKVINLTKFLNSKGQLNCSIPSGSWTIIRFGYTTTGSTNHPAVSEGHGLEVDKMDTAAVSFQFEQALGRIIRESGSYLGKSFKGILFDSFEGGFQNWTDKFPAEFRRLRSYDITPYLPVLTGRVVGSLATSESLLWDFRRTLDELIAHNYFGTMQRLAHQHNLIVYSESQGGPLNPFHCNEFVDVPMNEFWTHNAAKRDLLIKQAVSTANIFGKKLVAAEAFSAIPDYGKWQNTPYTLKQPGDFAFTAGINRLVFHTYAHQPLSYIEPGFTMGRYGTHFGRLNTWWKYASEWTSYLSRSQYLLQQGKLVTDICFLFHNDIRYSFPSQMIEVPDGYDFDICYPEHLLTMKCQTGTLRFPHGQQYRVLILPDYPFMTLPTLRKIRELVRSGASVSGPPPVNSPGLKEHLEVRQEFQQLVSDIWAGLNGTSKTVKSYGKGKVYWGKPLEQILLENEIHPDVRFLPSGNNHDLEYIHREAENEDIYFISNQREEDVSATAQFRINHKLPEFWDPATGKIWQAKIFHSKKGSVYVPLRLEPFGSVFVIFRKPLPKKWIVSIASKDQGNVSPGSIPQIADSIRTFDDLFLSGREGVFQVKYSDESIKSISLNNPSACLKIEGSWKVKFLDGIGAPSQMSFDSLLSWTEHPEPGVRYYSGTAEYEKTVTLPYNLLKPDEICILELGEVYDIAEVFINGKQAGVLWKKPYAANISDFLKPGLNTISIRITNRWPNRLIGDEHIPVDYKYSNTGNKFTDGALASFPDWLYDSLKAKSRKPHTFTTWKHYSTDSPLVKSGLIGPVRFSNFKKVDLSDLY